VDDGRHFKQSRENDMSITPKNHISIRALKRRAKKLSTLHGYKHAQALDEAAKAAGYHNYKHALNASAASMSGGSEATSSAKNGKPDALQRFHDKARRTWSDAVKQVAPGPASTATWRGVPAILKAIGPFIGPEKNHAHFPSGGGHDFRAVRLSTEKGCLEFEVTRGLVYVVKPRSLTLERIDLSIPESFLVLELDDLKPSEFYARSDDAEESGDRVSRRHRMSEMVVDLGGGEYADREVWDRGYLSNEDEPLPEDARSVVRFFSGRVMLVTKGSLWNGAARTYDGIHQGMTNGDIRAGIEGAIRRMEDA